MTPSIEFAYIIGIAIGDGNISNPNKRAYRLRITCDTKYPLIIDRVFLYLHKVFPKNKVSKIKKKKSAIDISVYNNHINDIFGWKLENGKKIYQKISVPKWLDTDSEYIKYFIKGLFEADGCVYQDRGYTMVSFVSYNLEIINYVQDKLKLLDFTYTTSKHLEKNGTRYTLRIAKRSKLFIEYFNIKKE